MTVPKAEQRLISEMMSLVNVAKTCVINKEFESKVKTTDTDASVKYLAKQTLLRLIEKL